MADIDTLRSDIKELFAKLERGDVRERDFQRKLTEKSVELYRTAVQAKLEEGEKILAEHHVVHAHMKLAQSVLKEPDQEAVSLFASERRVLRVRAMLAPGRLVTCDERDETVIDDVSYPRIRALSPGKEYRTTEMAAGAVIVVLALLFHSYLMITGTILVVLGAVGILHGLLLPTRWVEVVTDGALEGKPIQIHGLWRKSGRQLLAVLRARVNANTQQEAPKDGGGVIAVDDKEQGRREDVSVRVLIVDDESTFRDTLAKVLRRRGFFVGVAGSGEEGLGILQAEDFDVVVLDLKMPGIGGMAALQEIPKVRPTTKVIMLTGHGSASAGVEAMSSQAVDFLLKPIGVDDLVSVITAAAAARPPKSG